MIKILATQLSQALDYLRNRLDTEMAEYDLFVSKNPESCAQYLKEAIGCSSLVMVGFVGDSSALFADTFGLAMFYDKFAERNVKEFCKLSNIPLPPQHMMDKLCIAPESFNHYASSYGCQCTCYGEYKKTHVYMIPDDARECAVAFDNYLSKDLFRDKTNVTCLTYKVFGLNNSTVNDRLSKLGKFVSRKCETINLDTKIVLYFPSKTAKSVIEETSGRMKELFGDFIYAKSDQTLAKTVVDLLNSLDKKLSVAESVTGGMIASSIVDVAGASNVLYEGVVTYSVSAKCSRLGLNPHFIDEYGVVSQQVAQEMAIGLRQNGTDVAVSITGFAGPTADDGLPVGLCYIGVATEKGVSVYRNVFSGGRNSIRAQATNMALYLVFKTLTK